MRPCNWNRKSNLLRALFDSVSNDPEVSWIIVPYQKEKLLNRVVHWRRVALRVHQSLSHSEAHVIKSERYTA